MIIVDTNVLSELLHPLPQQRLLEWLADQDGVSIYLTGITEVELRVGAASLSAGKRRDVMIDRFAPEDFAGGVLPFGSPAESTLATISAAAISADRRAIVRPIAYADCHIARITRVRGAAGATRKTSDVSDCGITRKTLGMHV